MVLFILLAPISAHAAESPAVTSPRATATLVSETDAVQPGKEFRVGLRLQIAPGWHTYWKNPGDAGAAPELVFTLPPGADAGAIAWPAPDPLREGPITTYAYTGDLLLPVRITAASAPVTIEATADWLVCREICVPEHGKFRLDLPVGQPVPSAQAEIFASADARMPREMPWPARIGPDGTLRIEGAEIGPATVTSAVFLPAEPGTIEAGAAQPLVVDAGAMTLKLEMGKNFRLASPLDGVLTVHDRSGKRADFAVHAIPASVVAVPTMGLSRVILFAFFGGLILNAMPCVFPILALKVFSVTGGQARARANALSYTAGILVAFSALGAMLLLLRAGGATAGWGFQFQSPVFVAGMAWLLFAVGLNFSGVFEIGGGYSGIGQGLAARGGHAGSFFTGLLAVLVATPCTAPFMGVAIAAALASTAAVTMTVFLAMGLGLAAPFLVLALFPPLARLAPKPGRWMVVFRQALAFPMYGAAIWLLWVMAQEAGPAGVLATAGGALLIGFSGWAWNAAAPIGPDGVRSPASRFARAMALAAVLAAAAVAAGIGSAETFSGIAAVEADTERYSADRLAALRAEGRPVFVNMTAAWCVTCLVNERLALGSEAVRDYFSKHGIAYLKGDWTRQDPAITGFLHEHGRDGVPLYVFFPPANAPPTILPQILTENTVLDAVRPN